MTATLPGQNMDNRGIAPAADSSADYVILGGGLAGSLAALALAAARPAARVVLVEQGPALGGNHTWSFHDGDIPAEARGWVEPLVAHRWTGHDVRFPGTQRRLDGGYASITSAQLDRVVRNRLSAVGFEICCGDRAVAIGPNLVRLASGRSIAAGVVLDARGIPADGRIFERSLGRCGYQKFVGLEVELAADRPPAPPMLMDADVAQQDGFRFVYVLPFGPRRLLIEDTYYSDAPDLARQVLRDRVLDYARAHGLRVAAVVREEAGVLPLPLDGLGSAPAGSPLGIGYRAGWFHPLTGYSLPAAVQVALAIAGAAEPAGVPGALARAWASHQRQARFCQWLARLMFGAVAPAQRWRLLARFYRLPEPTIARFYALRMTWRDRLRLLAGRPAPGIAQRSISPMTEVQ